MDLVCGGVLPSWVPVGSHLLPWKCVRSVCDTPRWQVVAAASSCGQQLNQLPRAFQGLLTALLRVSSALRSAPPHSCQLASNGHNLTCSLGLSGCEEPAEARAGCTVGLQRFHVVYLKCRGPTWTWKEKKSRWVGPNHPCASQIQGLNEPPQVKGRVVPNL